MTYSIDFSGQVAIITGAAKGIGKATAKILTQAGAQVVINDIVPDRAVENVLDEFENVGLRPWYQKVDISNEKNAKSLIENSVNEFSRIDIFN